MIDQVLTKFMWLKFFGGNLIGQHHVYQTNTVEFTPLLFLQTSHLFAKSKVYQATLTSGW